MGGVIVGEHLVPSVAVASAGSAVRVNIATVWLALAVDSHSPTHQPTRSAPRNATFSISYPLLTHSLSHSVAVIAGSFFERRRHGRGDRQL